MNKILKFVAGALLLAAPGISPAAAEPLEEAATAGTQNTEAALRAEVEELKNRLERLERLLTEKLEEPPAAATEVATAVAPAPAAPVAPTHAEPQADLPIGVASSGGQPISITGLLDTYFTENVNNPVDGTNTLFFTNPNSRGFGLNQFKLEVDAKGQDSPVGVRADVWFGSGARLFREGLEPGRLEDVINLQQAYGYYQWDNGAELDFGLFNTIAGLEVAESHLNWNYTRGVLWAWNEPFSHLGAKFSAPITDTFTGTVMLVNGFDNAFDQNSGKSYGLQGSWAPSDRFNTTLTWIHGPENDLTNDGWQRDLSWNTYLSVTDKFEIMSNLDWISNTDPSDVKIDSWGIGGYARYHFTDKLRFAQRFEYFDDKEGRATGTNQVLKEYTATFEYAPERRFITRFEYRRDWSTTRFFSRGLSDFNDNQDTFTVGMMWIFGPKE